MHQRVLKQPDLVQLLFENTIPHMFASSCIVSSAVPEWLTIRACPGWDESRYGNAPPAPITNPGAAVFASAAAGGSLVVVAVVVAAAAGGIGPSACGSSTGRLPQPACVGTYPQG